MRIGIDCRSYGPEYGYKGQYTKSLVSHLVKNNDGNEYILFFLDREFSEFVSNSSWVHTVKTSAKIGSIAEQTTFPHELYKQKLDLMIFGTPNIPVAYYKKSIVILSDLVSYFYPEKELKSSLRRHFSTFILRQSIGKAVSIIAFSEVLKRDIIEIFDTREEKIQVIPPICPEIQRGEEDEVIQFLKKEGISEKYILSVGELREYKNIPRLLQSYAALLKEKIIDADLILIGKEDPTYHEIRSTLIQLELQNRVHIYNVLDEEKIGFFYQNASLYILPSLYEGSEENILLPLSYNLPIVSANLPSITHILGKNEAEFFRPMSISDITEALKKGWEYISNKRTKKDMSVFSGANISKQIHDIFSSCGKKK